MIPAQRKQHKNSITEIIEGEFSSLFDSYTLSALAMSEEPQGTHLVGPNRNCQSALLASRASRQTSWASNINQVFSWSNSQPGGLQVTSPNASSVANPPQDASYDLSLKDLLDDKICPSCLSRFLERPSLNGDLLKPQTPSEKALNVSLEHVLNIYARRRSLKNMAKLPPSVSVTAISRRNQELIYMITRFEEASNEASLPLLIREAYEALKTEAEMLAKKIGSLLGGDQVRTKVEAKVRKILLPKGAPSILLDETLRLVGIASYQAHGNATLREIVENYALREGPNPVLLVPAYFEAVITHLVGFKPNPYSMLLSTAVESKELAQTAAALWAPDQDGPLASLTQAVLSAQALLE